jgi:competence protein ComEC
LEGRVASLPEWHGRDFRFLLKPSRLIVPPAPPQNVSGLILVHIPEPDFAAGRGDRIEVQGSLVRPRASTVPGAFDFREFLARRGVHSVLYASADAWRLVDPAPPTSPWRWTAALRNRLLTALDTHLSPPAAALLAGLMLGMKPTQFPDMDQDFRRSGTYHLLVASGSNVGFVMALWFLVSRWILFLPKRAAWTSSILWAFLYAGVAGASPPVVRAAVMAAAVTVAYLLAREDRPEHAVALSAGFLLAVRPSLLFDVGFQMSYAAVLGVVLGVPALESVVRVSRGRGILRVLFASFCAQLALAPLLLHYFHRLSWVGLAANLVAVPWAAVCLASGIFFSVWQSLAPAGPATLGLAYAVEKVVMGLWAAVRVFAEIPGGEGRLAWNSLQTVILAAVVAATFLLVGGKRFPAEKLAPSRRPWALAGLLWLAGLPLLVAAGGPTKTGRLSVVWLDVGLGDSMVVTSPGGHITVVDVGDTRAGQYAVGPYLRGRAIRRIQDLILTQADPAHAGGLEALLAEIRVDQVSCSRATWNDLAGSAGRRILEAGGTPVRFLRDGDEWSRDSALWRVMIPVPASQDPDHRALVLLVKLKDHAALLTSDLPPIHQGAILRRVHGPISALQWPHHGRVQPDPAFLRQAGAQWTVVSGDVLPGFARGLDKPRVYVTGRDGSLEWTTDGRVPGFRLLVPPRPAVAAAG